MNDPQSRIRRWTQSGKIYYQSKDDLYALDVSNGASQKVTSLGRGPLAWIDVSPDERSIAFATQINDAWTITVGGIAGDGMIEVAKGIGKVDGEAWLPEKKKLFYSATADGVLQVFVSEIGSGRTGRITASETDTSIVDASLDGKSIVVTSAKEESNLWRVGVSDTQESPIIRDINAKIWPDVSPANDKIVFQSVKGLSQGNKLLDTALVLKTSSHATIANGPQRWPSTASCRLGPRTVQRSRSCVDRRT